MSPNGDIEAVCSLVASALSPLPRSAVGVAALIRRSN